jgi:hypothetical protein
VIIKKYDSLGYPMELRIVLKTIRPKKVGIIARDANDTSTIYTQRWNTVKGRQEFFIKMPQSPKQVEVGIFNISKDKNHDGIQILEFQQMPLNHNLNAIGLENKDVVSFIELAQEFSERASYLSAGIYPSNNGKFVINYLEAILNSTTGKEVSTPARINIITHQIQISKKIFKRYTVPGRMAILLHEFSHVFLNKNSSDEIEADLNAARIYLGLGYPRVELMNTWANVFYKANTPGNRERWRMVKDYILKFDRL